MVNQSNQQSTALSTVVVNKTFMLLQVAGCDETFVTD